MKNVKWILIALGLIAAVFAVVYFLDLSTKKWCWKNSLTEHQSESKSNSIWNVGLFDQGGSTKTYSLNQKVFDECLKENTILFFKN